MKETVIGYWRNLNDPSTDHLPTPVANESKDGKFVYGTTTYHEMYAFCHKLAVVEHILLAKEQMAYHNRNVAFAGVIAYRGWSTCRCCGKHNGSREFVSGNFRWPEGYRHYLQDHLIEPDPEFKQFIEFAFSVIIQNTG